MIESNFLNSKTQEAIDQMRGGKSLFITGGAGVGKSYTLNEINRYITKEFPNKRIARTALTGMASLLYEDGGQTLHSCLGLGINKNLESLKHITSSKYFKNVVRHAIMEIDILFIDEISILRSDTLDLVDGILKNARESDLPFGGLQTIFSGDFMQLAPIVKSDERLPEPWAFQSKTWESLNLEIIYLQEIKRQTDLEFSHNLSMVRVGNITREIDLYFSRAVHHELPPSVRAVKLLSTNDAVDSLNREELDKCGTKDQEVTYKADSWGKTDKLRDSIVKDCTAPEILQLRPECQVMILTNGSNREYVNGTMGIFKGHKQVRDIKGKLQDCLIVKLMSSDSIVLVPIYEWKTEIINEEGIVKVAYFKQFPVKLAYAITIHKSQGMSIDYLEVDLGKCFAKHMAYVALSRARTYEGLRVVNWNSRSVKFDRDALEFYRRLDREELSIAA